MAVAISRLYLFHWKEELNLPVYKYFGNNSIFKIRIILRH